MGKDLQAQKKQVRSRVKSLLKRLPPEENERRSRNVVQRLLSLEVYKKAKNVLFYASLSDEVDTFLLMRQELGHKGIYLPRICQDRLDIYEIKDLEKDLEKSTFEIKEPLFSCRKANSSELDVVLVPGVAFDRFRNRLGRGKGYYDKFLRNLPSRITRIGLCFSFQVLNNLPHGPRDWKVDILVTDKEII